jgi:hypothetical protein
MAKPQTRTQFKDYCLRRLGFPVITINVDEDQIDERIDDALQFFNDYHFDGVQKMYMKHMLTSEDIERRWIYVPDAVTFVTGVLPFDDSNSSINMFDLRYQLRLHDLYDFTSVSYVSYEITMQHIRSLNLLFSGTPQFRFNRHQNKLFLDIQWDQMRAGEYVIVDCYRKLNPDSMSLSGTLNGSQGSKTIIGTNTIFDQEILENDFIRFSDGRNLQVRRIKSPTEIEMVYELETDVVGLTAIKEGLSDVYDDRFLKRYTTALIKRQWGENLKKFGGITMPGGVTLNGKEIYDEAIEEINRIEDEIYNLNSLPSEIYTG